MEQSHTSLTLKRWIIFTTYGWFIGILLVLGFAALGEAILRMNGNSSGQAAVGIGMGTGVGLMQWWVIRNTVAGGQRWFWFYVLGFSFAYVLLDIIAANITTPMKAEMATPFATLTGAFITGWLHYKFVLKRIVVKAISWVVYMTIGWFSAHLITATIVLFNNIKFGEHIPRIVVFIFALSFITIGGPLLGYITGRFIVPRIEQYQLIGSSIPFEHQ